LLWCILNHTATQTNATTKTVSRQLNHINSIMEECRNDILEFNTKPSSLQNQYVEQTCQDFNRSILITKLFEAYKLSTNQEFVNFIVQKELHRHSNLAFGSSTTNMSDEQHQQHDERIHQHTRRKLPVQTTHMHSSRNEWSSTNSSGSPTTSGAWIHHNVN
jgi:septum formation inhibitor MinC